MSISRATSFRGRRLPLLAALLLAACRTSPTPTVTPAPSVTPPPSATPAAATATAATAQVPGFLIAAPDRRVLFIDTNGQERLLVEVPESRYVLADISGVVDGGRVAYAVGPQGAQPLDFIEVIGQGFAAYQPMNGAGKLAWDNWAINPDTGQLDSQIFTSGLEGSQARAVLRDSGDKILREVCLDDIRPDESQVSHHCAEKVISVLSPAGGGVTQIQAPADVADFGALGDARFSPDGSRLAFGLTRGAPPDEQGWVAVSQGMSGPARLIAASPADDYFAVWGWLDEQTLILQLRAIPSVWLVGADGSDLRRIADGILLGVVGR